ncbi:MAG: tRNA epoxyqueuosine(34) reductase QueG [Armatimonadetes bacterium]|nr:tRNA epoxyqueuosine(34) reductase QueG [Armatimonadota bacterium]
MDLKAALRERAYSLGFELFGVAAATPAETRAAYEEWLAAGYAGEMAYLGRDPARRADPRRAWPDTAAILVVGLNYRPVEEESQARSDPTRGRFARYALGDDYHEVLATRLRALLATARELGGPEVEGRVYVDTGPLLERDLAARAGLGWFGKNTMLLNRRYGSYFFLGALLLNVPLTPDGPVSAHCGTCTRCLNACPTGAFVAPYVLDARRCISYLTIELKGPIPRPLRPLVGNWVFGCDICQEVCPWNRKAPPGDEPAFSARQGLPAPELVALLALTPEAFRERFRRSPVKRARRRGLLRNVCVALGNSGDRAVVPHLARALHDEEALVRGHAAWALGRLGGEEAAVVLHAALATEEDPWVREEIEAAWRETQQNVVRAT